MKEQFPYLDFVDMERWIPEMERLQVSKVARSKGQFIDQYRRRGPLSKLWRQKRDAFVARHLAQYTQHPTYRRWLALVAWAYLPELPPPRHTP